MQLIKSCKANGVVWLRYLTAREIAPTLVGQGVDLFNTTPRHGHETDTMKTRELVGCSPSIFAGRNSNVVLLSSCNGKCNAIPPTARPRSFNSNPRAGRISAGV